MAELTRDLVADTVEGVRPIESDWQEALEALGKGQIDADPAFLLSTLSASGQGARPYVALLRRGNAISSAIIGRRVRRAIPFRLGFLRLQSPTLECLEVVHGGYLSDGRPESLAWSHDHLRSLLATRKVECIVVLHLSEEDAAYPRLTSGLLAGRKPALIATDHWLATLIDPSTGNKIERHSSRTKRTFRRKDRMLIEHFGAPPTMREFREPGDVKEFVVAASQIGARSYQAGINVGVRDDERWHTLLGSLAELGYLSGHLLVAAGEPIAYALGSVYRSTYLLIATSFLPEHRSLSPGAYLLRAVISDMEEKGVATLDFGFGDSEYKRLHGNVCVREVLIRFYGFGPRARAAEAMGRSAAALTRWLEPLLQRSGMGARVKRLWRRRMEGRD